MWRQRAPQLAGQTVVVIGGSAGIGLETTQRAHAKGAAIPDQLAAKSAISITWALILSAFHHFSHLPRLGPETEGHGDSSWPTSVPDAVCQPPLSGWGVIHARPNMSI